MIFVVTCMFLIRSLFLSGSRSSLNSSGLSWMYVETYAKDSSLLGSWGILSFIYGIFSANLNPLFICVVGYTI